MLICIDNVICHLWPLAETLLWARNYIKKIQTYTSSALIETFEVKCDSIIAFQIIKGENIWVAVLNPSQTCLNLL